MPSPGQMATILIGTNRPPCPARLYGYGTKNGQTCFTYVLCCTLISLDHHHHKHTYASRTYIHIPNTHTRTQIIGGWIEARDRKFAKTHLSGRGEDLGHIKPGTHWLARKKECGCLHRSWNQVCSLRLETRALLLRFGGFPFVAQTPPFSMHRHTHCTHRNAR